ncbi:HAD family phosphatase [Cellulomonas sp. PS-H5]|uniref:HAD family hydrolase n=1 Tax=Cellulomonas sp. PS-H5 TaxID=2820400 RepID=UPI001C4FE259|nr:HAD family hydrolase [Cellulomonas sp. PS-H5]MBW0256260.1 HAD-IB family hydrolase [Cellulomonas sp. PS-H5]
MTHRPTSPAPPVGGAPPARAAAFFDLDKTVIATSAASAFARPFLSGGLLTRRAALRSAAAQLAFLLGSATEGRTERVRAQLSAMVAGWDVERVSSIVAASLQEAIGPVVYAEALDLVAEHHAAGHDVVVVSASSAELVEPIAELIGADEVIASRMGVADGRYTGEIAFYAYGPAKADAMRELAERRGYDLAASSAYTDSATDAPMLRVVGHGYVVNPDRALRRLAGREGWTPLVFRRHVAVGAGRRRAALRQLTGPAARRGVLVAGAAALVAAAGLTTWAVRTARAARHRRRRA